MKALRNCHTRYHCCKYPFRDVNITRCCTLALMCFFFVIYYISKIRCWLHIIWTMRCNLIDESLCALCDIMSPQKIFKEFIFVRIMQRNLSLSWYCLKVVIEYYFTAPSFLIIFFSFILLSFIKRLNQYI